VGSAAQIKAMKQVAGRLKGELAQFRELAAFAQFGSDLDAKTQAQIERGKRIMEVFKQPPYDPIPVEMQVAVLWVAQNGFMDDVPVENVKDFQSKLMEFLTTRRAALLAKIQKEMALSDTLTGELKAAATEFKQTYKVPAQAPAGGDAAPGQAEGQQKAAATEKKAPEKKASESKQAHK
jgi:F-type H+/Na+-transporting ATPase subunit alpha